MTSPKDCQSSPTAKAAAMMTACAEGSNSSTRPWRGRSTDATHIDVLAVGWKKRRRLTVKLQSERLKEACGSLRRRAEAAFSCSRAFRGLWWLVFLTAILKKRTKVRLTKHPCVGFLLKATCLRPPHDYFPHHISHHGLVRLLLIRLPVGQIIVFFILTCRST
jgi:hypothetical protein